MQRIFSVCVVAVGLTYGYPSALAYEPIELWDLDTADLLEAAETGGWQAQLRVAERYENDIPALRDMRAAEYWYRTAAAHQNAEAEYALVCFLARGIEFGKKVEARRRLETMMTAHPNYAPAAITYLKFVGLGVGGKRDDEAAERLIRDIFGPSDASDQGNSSDIRGPTQPSDSRITEKLYILLDVQCGPGGEEAAERFGVEYPLVKNPKTPRLVGHGE